MNTAMTILKFDTHCTVVNIAYREYNHSVKHANEFPVNQNATRYIHLN